MKVDGEYEDWLEVLRLVYYSGEWRVVLSALVIANNRWPFVSEALYSTILGLILVYHLLCVRYMLLTLMYGVHHVWNCKFVHGIYCFQMFLLAQAQLTWAMRQRSESSPSSTSTACNWWLGGVRRQFRGIRWICGHLSSSPHPRCPIIRVWFSAWPWLMPSSATPWSSRASHSFWTQALPISAMPWHRPTLISSWMACALKQRTRSFEAWLDYQQISGWVIS